MRPTRRDEVDGAGAVLEVVRGVEHLEHPLEADERGHHVDPGVGELGERPVDAGDEGGQGHEGARAERAVDDEDAPEPVDGRGGERADEAEGDEEGAAVHGGAHADGAHAVGPGREVGRLVVELAEQLHQQRAGHVEALGHRGVHRRVEVHLLAGELLQPSPDPLRGHDEQRQDHEG